MSNPIIEKSNVNKKAKLRWSYTMVLGRKIQHHKEVKFVILSVSV